MKRLTTDGIRAAIGDETRARLDELEVFSELESTNSHLLERECPSPGRYRVALAEYQTKGRGRMDRRWISPPSSGLCMSVAFTFSRRPDDFVSLSPAVGIGVAQALEKLGARGIGLKWPNDLVAQDHKLGGILPEVHPRKASGVTIVVGIGLNIDLRHSDTGTGIVSSLGGAVDLAACCDPLPSRSVIAAALIESLVDTMARFETGGFSSFHRTWRRYDWLHGREVTIERADSRSAGIAGGVDTDGALLLNAGGVVQRFMSGSIIVRDGSDVRP